MFKSLAAFRLIERYKRIKIDGRIMVDQTYTLDYVEAVLIISNGRNRVITGGQSELMLITCSIFI